MQNLVVIIIPQWIKLPQENREFYDSLYESLSEQGINVGFATQRSAFIRLLTRLNLADNVYIFLLDESLEDRNRIFIEESLKALGEGVYIRGVSELVSGESEGLKEKLEVWLQEGKKDGHKERKLIQ